MNDFDGMVQARLFHDAVPWPMDVSEIEGFNKVLETAGLVETGPGDGWKKTPWGDAMNLDLLMVFLGIWDRFDVPWILQKNGLIDATECGWLEDLLGVDDSYAPLLPAIRRAYTRAMDKGVIRWRIN